MSSPGKNAAQYPKEFLLKSSLILSKQQLGQTQCRSLFPESGPEIPKPNPEGVWDVRNQSSGKGFQGTSMVISLKIFLNSSLN